MERVKKGRLVMWHNESRAYHEIELPTEVLISGRHALPGQIIPGSSIGVRSF